MREFFALILDLLVYGLVGAASAWFYYHYRRRDLLGGFWGALVIGAVGAVLITWMSNFNNWFINLVYWLMVPKWEDKLLFRVNLIAAVIGAFLFVYILNRINHNKERRY